MIYIIRENEITRGRFCIGYTSDFDETFSNMKSASPSILKRIAIVPGDQEAVKALHKMIAAYHINENWFLNTNETRAFVKIICDMHGEEKTIPENPRPKIKRPIVDKERIKAIRAKYGTKNTTNEKQRSFTIQDKPRHNTNGHLQKTVVPLKEYKIIPSSAYTQTQLQPQQPLPISLQPPSDDAIKASNNIKEINIEHSEQIGDVFEAIKILKDNCKNFPITEVIKDTFWGIIDKGTPRHESVSGYIYIFIHNDELLYVGMTSQRPAHKRIRSHLYGNLKFDLYLKEIPEDEYADMQVYYFGIHGLEKDTKRIVNTIETKLISTFNPTYNVKDRTDYTISENMRIV